MRTLTQSAQAAKAIKKELTAAFPGIKFSVKSDNYSMGDSVHISWTDGPTSGQVENITCKYQYGSFNGMEDIYESTNRRDDIPQAKYVSCSRHCVATDFLRDDFNKMIGANSWDNYFWRIQAKTAIPLNATNFRIERTEETAGLTEDLYRIAFDVPETEEKATTKINGTFVIIDYSEKAVAVFGDTKTVKDELKSLGGRFNPYLTREGQKQAGWIFPKTKREELEAVLNSDVIKSHSTDQPVKAVEINLSEPLRKKAEAVQQQAENIDDSVKGNWTHRRQRMADSMGRKKEGLFNISRVLFALSDGWSAGTIDPELKRIKTRSDVELFLTGYFPNPPESGFNGWYAEEYRKLKKRVDSLGIYSKDQFEAVKAKVKALAVVELTEEQKKENEKAELLKKIHAANIPGFFPTPDELIDRMIDLSGIDHVESILEPSAGIGSIAHKVKPLCDLLECCEINWTLYDYLKYSGFNMVERNIYDVSAHKRYDAIFMNPPFEGREDLKHVMHCFSLLNDSGVLVSIISAGKLKPWFESWLDDKVYEIHDVEAGAFKNAFNSTGVGVKIIVINK